MKQQKQNEALQEAVNKINNGLLSTSAAAKIYKIPRTIQIKKKEQTQMKKNQGTFGKVQKKMYIQNFCTVLIFSVLSVAMEEQQQSSQFNNSYLHTKKYIFLWGKGVTKINSEN